LEDFIRADPEKEKTKQIMVSLETCKEYRILAEREDESSFIMEYEHKKKGLFSQHIQTQKFKAIQEDSLPDKRCL